MYKYMTTQNNRLTPVLSNNLVQSDGVTKTQKQTIFENMSDGIITVTADGLINYVNSAATQIFDLSGRVTGRAILCRNTALFPQKQGI